MSVTRLKMAIKFITPNKPPLKRSFNCGRSTSSLITEDNMNQKLKAVEYAVRGPILTRAKEIQKELASGVKKPFDRVIQANLGDAQAMGQKPITFYRQVLALVSYPQLFNDSNFPPDAICRAKTILENTRGGSMGSYTDSFGIDLIRKHCAEYIKERDGFDSNWEDIMLSAGASEAIKNVLKLLNESVNGKPPGVMVPIPQYPLYSATISEFGMHLIGYYLDESKNWGLNIQELCQSYQKAASECSPRVLVVINPGNPTGQVLTKQNVKEIVEFAYDNKLFLMADEVYQHNVYAEGSQFHSFKKIMQEMGSPYNKMELASFMSCSKGFMGECGFRGGYCELINISPEVRAHFSKLISTTLCPTSLGQTVVDCVVKPPCEGDPSYDLFMKEKNNTLNNFKEKGKMIETFFNSVEGFSCNEVQGAMYAFPKLDLPPKAIEEAKSKNMPADTFYAFQLLEATGICVVPGSGFKQQPGTYHFRTTILPPMDQLKRMLETFKEFQLKFLEKYR